MFHRGLSAFLQKASDSFPVVILTGARQTGKSTLCRTLFPNSAYVSLEDPDTRQRVLDDPRTFLKMNPPPLILDEIQYAPDIPSYLQGLVDQDRHRYGQYLLTGSQNFLLMHKISQSLAGRAALLTLFPCSVAEIDGEKAAPRSEPEAVADWILRGGYPEMRARPDLDRRLWCSSYIRLYLERDVRNLLNIGDLETFERFLRLTAIRTGQILNISDLARDAGVSSPTATRWLSVLKASYQVHFLEPFAVNLSKRIVKAPKIYFCDTALATYLMGIHDSETLLNHPSFGALFETASVLEHLKWGTQQGDMPHLSYFRTKEGLEVDLIVEEGSALFLREIKSTRTLTPGLGDALEKTRALLKRKASMAFLAPVEKTTALTSEIEVRPWHDARW